MTPQQINDKIRRLMAQWTKDDVMMHPGAYIASDTGAIDDGASYGADERPAWIKADLEGWQEIKDDNR